MCKERDGRGVALLCVVTTAVGWSSIPIFLRYFTGYLDAWTVNGIRYSVGALFWLPYVLLMHRRTKGQAPPVPGRSVWRDALVPLVPNVLGQVGYAISPYYLPASTIGFALRLSFLFTIVFGLLVLAEERLLAHRPVFWFGVVASLGGVALLFMGKLGDGSGASVVGMVILVASTIAWGAYAVSVRHRMAPYPVRQSFGVISLYTSVALVVLMLIFGNVGALAEFTPRLWAFLIASALIGVAFGHVFYHRGIHRLGPVVASGVLLVTPFLTYLGSAIFLKESMTAMQLAGGVSVVVGGALLVRARAEVDSTRDAAQMTRDAGRGTDDA